MNIFFKWECLGFQETQDVFNPYSVYHHGQFHKGPETMGMGGVSSKETFSKEGSNGDEKTNFLLK